MWLDERQPEEVRLVASRLMAEVRGELWRLHNAGRPRPNIEELAPRLVGDDFRLLAQLLTCDLAEPARVRDRSEVALERLLALLND